MVKRRTEFQEMYLVDAYLLNRLSNENKNINHNTNSISINNKQPEKEWSHPPPTLNNQNDEFPSSNSSIRDEKSDMNTDIDNDTGKYDCIDCKEGIQKKETKGEHKFSHNDASILSLPKSFQQNITPTQSVNHTPLDQVNIDRPMIENNIHSFHSPINPTLYPSENYQFKPTDSMEHSGESFHPPMEVEDDTLRMINPLNKVTQSPLPTSSFHIHPVTREILNLNNNWATSKKKENLKKKKENKKYVLKQTSKARKVHSNGNNNINDDIKKLNYDGDRKRIEYEQENQLTQTPPISNYPPQSITSEQHSQLVRKNNARDNVGNTNDKKKLKFKFNAFYCTLCEPNTFFEKRKALERHMENIHDAFRQKNKGTKRSITERNRVNKRNKTNDTKYTLRYLKYT